MSCCCGPAGSHAVAGPAGRCWQAHHTVSCWWRRRAPADGARRSTRVSAGTCAQAPGACCGTWHTHTHNTHIQHTCARAGRGAAAAGSTRHAPACGRVAPACSARVCSRLPVGGARSGLAPCRALGADCREASEDTMALAFLRVTFTDRALPSASRARRVPPAVAGAHQRSPDLAAIVVVCLRLSSLDCLVSCCPAGPIVNAESGNGSCAANQPHWPTYSTCTRTPGCSSDCRTPQRHRTRIPDIPPASLVTCCRHGTWNRGSCMPPTQTAIARASCVLACQNRGVRACTAQLYAEHAPCPAGWQLERPRGGGGGGGGAGRRYACTHLRPA
jgi:hypothetical protein